MRERQAGPIASVILGIVFAGAGIATCYFSKPTLDDARASADWPSVRGKITHSKVVRRKSNDGGRSYSATVEYSYEVDGKKHSDDTIWFGMTTSSRRATAERLVDQFRPGQEVDVYYDPDMPGLSVLLPGAFLSSYAVFGVGVLFAVIGCLATLTVVLKFGLLGWLVMTKSG